MPQKKINAFSKFFFEVRSRPENAGKSDAETQDIADKEWRSMGATEKSNYKERAKRGGTIPGPPGPGPFGLRHFNCIDGSSIESQLSREKQRVLKQKTEKIVISDMLQNSMKNNSPDDIFDEVFYIFCASYFAKSDVKIFPAEIALAKFTLKEGVLDSMNILVNPGRLPIGWPGEAVMHSRRTHRLDLPPNIEGCRCYTEILESIKSFVGATEFTSEEIPPFFCYSELENDEIVAAELTLEKIAEENGKPNAFQVFKADSLLYLLRKVIVENRNLFSNTTDRPFHSPVHAWDMLRRDDYRYCSIGCEKHNEDDNSTECALSKALRLCYSFVQYCSDKRFKKIAGKHYPITYTVQGVKGASSVASFDENVSEEEEEENDGDWGISSKGSEEAVNILETFRQLSLAPSSSTLTQRQSLVTANSNNSIPATISIQSTVSSLNLTQPNRRVSQFRMRNDTASSSGSQSDIIPENVESWIDSLTEAHDM
jgi:hypothetical protein